jgi:hypothetical protein
MYMNGGISVKVGNYPPIFQPHQTKYTETKVGSDGAIGWAMADHAGRNNTESAD